MVRFLTPAKIGLLVLLQLYVADAVPSEAIYPVLSFITTNLLDHDHKSSSQPALRWGKVRRTASMVSTICEFEKLLGSYPFVMGMPGRRLWDLFVDGLWALDSLDAMHNFLLALPALLCKTKAQLRMEGRPSSPSADQGFIRLSRHSFLGAFVRDVAYEISDVPFHDIADLWRDFVKYRLPTILYFRHRSWNFELSDSGGASFSHAEHGWVGDEARTLAYVVYGDFLRDNTKPVSTDDISMLLEFQIEQMQSKSPYRYLLGKRSANQISEYGSRVPLEVRHEFQSLLDDNTLRPSLNHYLK